MKKQRRASVEPETLTVEQAGRVLGIGRALSYTLARRGDLPTIRLGNRLVVPKAQLKRLLEGESD